jgi:hypothetical protein
MGDDFVMNHDKKKLLSCLALSNDVYFFHTPFDQALTHKINVGALSCLKFFVHFIGNDLNFILSLIHGKLKQVV